VAPGTRGYLRRAVRMSFSERAVQVACAAAAVALAILLAAQRSWPFDASQPRLPGRPSLSQLLLSDHITFGFLRLALVMLAVFVVASVPALAARKTKRELDEVTYKLDDARKERDRAIALSKQLSHGP